MRRNLWRWGWRTCWYKTFRYKTLWIQNLLEQNLLLNTSGNFHEHRQGTLTWANKEFSQAPLRNFHMHHPRNFHIYQQGIFTFQTLSSNSWNFFRFTRIWLAAPTCHRVSASQLYLTHSKLKILISLCTCVLELFQRKSCAWAQMLHSITVADCSHISNPNVLQIASILATISLTKII